MYQIWLSDQDTSAEDASVQILQRAVPELVMHFPGAQPMLRGHRWWADVLAAGEEL